MNGPRKTIAELIAENRTVSAEEHTQAMEYERSLLGDGFRYPRDSEIYEAVADVEISYLTLWSAPFTGGETFILKKGAQIKVCVHPHNPEPLGVYASPVDGEGFEQEVVPEETRRSEGYGGYSLYIESAQLRRSFRLIGKASS